MEERLDHLVFATPELEAAVDSLATALGVRPVPGGRHPGRGTRNYVLGLGPGHYLEVIGPDEEQRAPEEGRPFGIDGLDRPRLVAWLAKSARLEEDAAAAARLGVDLGPIRSMSRTTPDGETLKWRLSGMPGAGTHVVPVLIDWGTTRHPSAVAPSGVSLASFRAEHPDPARVRAVLDALGLDLEVVQADHPRLIARLDGPAGSVELD